MALRSGVAALLPICCLFPCCFASANSTLCETITMKNEALKLVCDALTGNKKPPVPRSNGFKVIGAGAGRTGTMSLQAAFEILGFRSYHMKELLLGDHSPIWHEALRQDSPEPALETLLALGFDASADEPVNRFALDLAKRFPDAKVVLTTRPPDRWAKSVSQLCGIVGVLRKLPWSLVPVFERFASFAEEFHLERGYTLLTNAEDFDSKAAVKWYEAQNAKIRASVPKGRLLDFEVSQGWGPLCAFLEVPVPEVPFPHVNDRLGLSIAIAVLNSMSVLFLASPLLIVLICYFCCCRGGSSSPTISGKKAGKTRKAD